MIIMDAKNFYTIKHELEEVRGLILENEYLQSKYPNKKRELELGLKSLKQLEKEMFESLKKESVNVNMEAYEIYLKGNMVNNGFMPMKQLGELLINSQDTITSLAAPPLNLNQSPSKNINDNTEMLVAGTSSGSLRILVVSNQKKLDNDESQTNLKNAFDKLSAISNYEGNLSDLNKNNEIGKKQISNYKKLLKSLSSMHLDMEIKKPSKDKKDKTLFKLNASDSLKIYKSFDKQPTYDEEISEIEGVIKAVDLDEYKFKIESNYSNRKEVIKGEFNKNFEKILVSNLNKKVLIELKNITQEFIDKRSKHDYELIDIKKLIEN